MEQRIGTLAQQKWISKLIENEFTMEYKAGHENKAADALLRINTKEGLFYAITISQPATPWLDKVKQVYQNDSIL